METEKFGEALVLIMTKHVEQSLMTRTKSEELDHELVYKIVNETKVMKKLLRDGMTNFRKEYAALINKSLEPYFHSYYSTRSFLNEKEAL